MTLTGSGFGATQGDGGVFLTGGTYPTVVTWNATQVVFTAPNGIHPGSVLVVQNRVNSNELSYTFVAPVLSSVSPTAWTPGMQVTLTGSGFGATQGGGGVFLTGGTYPTVVTWNASQVVFTVPSGINSTNVLVYQNGVDSNELAYTVVPAPNITSLSLTSGTVGTVVTITGSNLGNGQSAIVTFNGVTATPTSWANTSIAVPVPPAATSGNVLVTIGGLPSNGKGFTVVPNVTGISPTNGAVGATITITGTSFGASQGTSTVTFDGTAAAPTSWGASSIIVPVPTGAAAGNVVVTVGGVASNGVNFAVAPNITGLSPTSGVVGTSVTITGTGFGPTQGTSSITFNGTATTSTGWNGSSIAVPVPTGATTGNVVVTVGGLASNGVGFTVQPRTFVGTTGQMEASLYGQTATQLTTGQVLIAGGMSASGVENNAELYTATSQSFAAAANAMNIARWLHTATLLNDGTVLIAGGSNLSNETTLNSAEIYDPVAGTFTLLPNTLNTARVGHTATLLSNGQVLIVGGYDPATGIISDAELYDPTAQVFIDLGNTNTPHFHHTATLLQNGQVLITGGETDPTPSGAYNTAEVFNPATWTFTVLSVNMTTAREGHAAILLNKGQVLITGGDLPAAGSLNTAEIYDPVANTFTAVSATMTSPRIYHDAVLLNGGTVLL
ncbi:MAG: IPT/TIG domain-containing protein, partial [Candidatus Sulfotelmatobacter sp.]